ncbi:fimbrillin family protein [Parabacteroides sp. OttesenSCG-928-N08]|nr:fimbrillin family protein [Parabacteroides sp. OttesenSCG-928-N08]
MKTTISTMRSKRNLFFPLLCLFLLPAFFIACEPADDPHVYPVAPTVTAYIVETRATEAQWQDGDAIGLFTYIPNTTNVVDKQANFKYVNKAGAKTNGSFSPVSESHTIYFPKDRSLQDVAAYYPYQEGVVHDLLLQVDVTNQQNLPAIDLMTSLISKGHSVENSHVNLIFKHRLTKLELQLQGATENIKLDNPKVTLQGAAVTAKFNMGSQKITSYGEVKPLQLVVDQKLKSAEAIVIPTENNGDLSFEVEAGGKTFIVELPEGIHFEAGKALEMVMTLDSKESPRLDVKVSEWLGGPSVGMEALTIIVPEVPAGTSPVVTRFEMWKNDEIDKAVSYRFENRRWEGSPLGFNLESINENDLFRARHTPEKPDPITELKDILEAGPVSVKNKAVALDFKHIYSKLNIVLTKGENFPADANLKEAKVALLSYTLSGTSNSLIVEPETVKAGTKWEVTIGNYLFEATVDRDIDLKQGTESTITLRLSSHTEVSIDVTVSDWAVGESAEFDAIHFIIPSKPDIDEPAVTAFTLWKNRGTDEAVSADYSYQNGEWNAFPNPFFVNHITPTDRFSAEYIPEVADPISGVKDILRTPSVAMIDETLQLDFEHINAKVSISLAKGENFPADVDLKEAEFQLQGVSLKGISHQLLLEPCTLPVGKITEIKVGGRTYIVKSDKEITIAKGTTNRLLFTLDVQISDEATVYLDVTQQAWKVNEEVAVNAIAMLLPVDPVTGYPEVTTFTLTRYMAKGGARVVRYRLNGWTWETDTDPFILEEVQTGDLFVAEHIPDKADPVTGVSDILRTPRTTMAKDGALKLIFEHINSSLRLEIQKASYFLQPVDLANAVVTFDGYQLKGASHTLLYAPTALKEGTQISIRASDIVYYAYLEKSLYLEAGKSSTLKVLLNERQTQLSISSAIADWQVGETTEVEALQIAPQQATASQISSLDVWKTGEEAVSSYYYEAGRWQAATAPITVGDAANGARFYARHIPETTDQTTGLRDVLVADAVALDRGNALPHRLYHLMGQLEIALTDHRGESVPTEGTTIELELFSKGDIDENNQLTLRRETQTMRFEAGREYIVLPQQQQQLAVVVTTADGYRYNGTIESLSIQSNQKSALQIKLQQQGVALSIQTIDWGETIEAEVEVGGTDVVADLPTDLFPQQPGWILLETTGGINGAYRWDGKRLSSTQPLTWQSLDATILHDFSLTFTPDEGAPAPDILTGNTLAVGWGNSLTFESLTHLNSALIVKLKRGNGYDATAFDALARDARFILEGFQDRGQSYTYPYLMQPTLPIQDESINEAIVVPQPLTDHTLRFVFDGETHTIDLPAAFHSRQVTRFEANTRYQLTVTIHAPQTATKSAGALIELETSVYTSH